MAIKYGSSAVTAVKWGSTNITKVYWGSTLVFPESNLLNTGLNWSSGLAIRVLTNNNFGRAKAFSSATSANFTATSTNYSNDTDEAAAVRTSSEINSSVFNRLRVAYNWTFTGYNPTTGADVTLGASNTNISINVAYITYWSDFSNGIINVGTVGTENYRPSLWTVAHGDTYSAVNVTNNEGFATGSAARSGSKDFTISLASGTYYYFISVFGSTRVSAGIQTKMNLTFTALQLSKV